MEGRKNKNGNFIAQIAGKMCIGRMRFWKFFGNCQIGINEKAERVLRPLSVLDRTYPRQLCRIQ